MKTLFLISYNECNLGDDLFVRTILRRYPFVKFYSRDNHENTINCFSGETNYRIIRKDGWLLKKIGSIRASLAARFHNWQEERCAATIYIGGSLFIEYNNWQTILTWWKYVAEHRKFYVLGANFGPWHTEEYRKQMNDIFGSMQDVCFRDHYSKNLFPDNPKVRCAPDILLGYPMPSVEIKQHQAFISVIDCATKAEGENQLSLYDQKYTKSITALTQQLIDQGWHVVLSSFCEAEGDKKGIQKVLEGLRDSDEVETVSYNGFNTEEVLVKLAESSVVFGTRFHATILGFAARRPVIPLIYSDKTKQVLEDLNFGGKSFDIRRLDESFCRQASELATHTDLQYLRNIEEYAKQSEGHFARLDQLLRK